MAPSRVPKLSKKATSKLQIEDHVDENLEVSSPSILDTAEGGNIDSDSDSLGPSDSESSDVSPTASR
jgi:hypothetical protein